MDDGSRGRGCSNEWVSQTAITTALSHAVDHDTSRPIPTHRHLHLHLLIFHVLRSARRQAHAQTHTNLVRSSKAPEQTHVLSQYRPIITHVKLSTCSVIVRCFFPHSFPESSPRCLVGSVSVLADPFEASPAARVIRIKTSIVAERQKSAP